MTPADRAQTLMWRVMLDADAVDYRAAAHGLLELAERMAAENERLSRPILSITGPTQAAALP